MMNAVHIIIFIAEIFFLALGIKFWREKGSPLHKIVLVAGVFSLTFVLYLLPYIDGCAEYDKYAKWWIYLPECLSAAIKQLVGESKIELVGTYMLKYKMYVLDFYMAIILSLLVTFSTALSAFKNRIYNYFRCAKIMKADVCDIVVGQNEIALEYAMLNKNTIVFVDKAKAEDEDSAYIESGYTVLKKNFSVELLKSKLFKKDTIYNFIIPDTNDSFFYYYNIVSIYLDQKEVNNNRFFFLETNEKAAGVIQDHIANDESNLYSRFVRLFSRNELLARKFVEENPVTAHMPADFFESDTSVKKDVKINVMMLGFSALSKEIYNQLVINNQLVEYSDGEYKCHPVNYTIYSSSVDKNSWNIDGLKNTLEELEKNKDKYFPLPELPYTTTVIEKDTFDITQLARMCKTASAENTITYFIIDAGNTYQNIEISDNINQLMNYNGNYHIFVYNSSVAIQNENNVTSYGNIREIFTNGLIVNEELSGLAKSINKYYIERNSKNKLTDEQLEDENTAQWQKMSYFTLYSNIYLANSLRLKLNLLGLDYKKSVDGGNAGMLTDKYDRTIQQEKDKEYLKQDLRNAILAQEHSRWNAYHMLSHYMPLKKEKIGDCDMTKCQTADDFKKSVFDSRKNEKMKKHACLTTYNGVMEVGKLLAQKTNAVVECEKYTAFDFKFYENDDILFDETVAPKYLESNGYEVVEKTIV